MLRLKLIHVSKTGPRNISYHAMYFNSDKVINFDFSFDTDIYATKQIYSLWACWCEVPMASAHRNLSTNLNTSQGLLSFHQ